jgi:hypothetical protein
MNGGIIYQTCGSGAQRLSQNRTGHRDRYRNRDRSRNWNGSLKLQELPGVFAPIQNRVGPMSSLPLLGRFGIYSHPRAEGPALSSHGRKPVDSFWKIIKRRRRGTKVMSKECRPFGPHHFFHSETGGADVSSANVQVLFSVPKCAQGCASPQSGPIRPSSSRKAIAGRPVKHGPTGERVGCG